ncbi:MAG: alpha/beta hydrolase [Candidatus Omnitrophota bacterium]
MNYQIRGKGRNLFFIHGWGCDSRVWAKLVESLSKKFCVITIDLRGYGKSEWRSENDLLDAFATDILMLCKELNLKEINFIGWSLGCYVIFELLGNAPEIINSIVLVGGTPKFLKGDGFEFGFEGSNLRLMRRRLNRDFNGALLDFCRSIFFENNEGPQPNKDALISSLNILEHADFRQDIKRIDTPTLIVCGEGDSITPKAASEYLHKEIKGSKLVIIKDAGHVPFLTRPKEFNRILEKWINGR